MKMSKKPDGTESAKVTRIYTWILVGLFILFLGRFVQLMVFKTANGQDLTTLVHELYNQNEIVAAKRGTIYDISGETIAVDVKTYSIYAVITDRYAGTEYVTDKLGTAKGLAKHLAMSENDILRLLNQTNVNQTAFGNAGTNLSYEVKEAIEAEGLKGIYFTEKISRDYPKGYFANNLIGLARDTREDTTTPTQSNPLQGVMGLEHAYNAQLKGIDGITNYDKDFYGYPVSGTEQVIEKAQAGNNIYTTLDSRLTEYLESLLSDVYQRYQPQHLTAIVVRPKTGDVVAASQRPTFNQKAQLYPENGWVNQFVERAFEPGSTMKVLTLAAAINEGVFSPMDLYRSGSIEVGGITVQDWNTHGWGTISYLQGLSYSSNVAFVNIVSKIGYAKWKDYLDAFGFGKTTNSGFANETAGLNAYEREADKATTAFGQGISVSQLQMLQAFTAIANNGEMKKLRFVDRIENGETGEMTYMPVETLGTPIKAETAKWVRTYLEEVIYGTNATGSNFKVDGIRISGKTGTAQTYDPNQGKYLLDGNYLHSIVAFVPSENPQFIIYITLDRPKYIKNSTGMTEVFKPFVTYATTYIATQETTPSTAVPSVVVPDARGASVTEAKNALSNLGFKDVVILGDGPTIQNQMPVDNIAYPIDTKLVLYAGGSVKMPDMAGWSKQDVIKVASLLGMQVTYEGEGFVKSQSIPAGTTLTGQESLSITFSSSETRSLTSQTTTESSSSTTSTTSTTTTTR